MTSHPDTLKTCEACGASEVDCAWCTHGYQNINQRRLWQAFRFRMRSMSGTYSLLQEMIEDVIKKLTEHDTTESRKMASDGKMILSWWLTSAPDTNERSESTKMLSQFNKMAMDYLIVNNKY